MSLNIVKTWLQTSFALWYKPIEYYFIYKKKQKSNTNINITFRNNLNDIFEKHLLNFEY